MRFFNLVEQDHACSPSPRMIKPEYSVLGDVGATQDVNRIDCHVLTHIEPDQLLSCAKQPPQTKKLIMNTDCLIVSHLIIPAGTLVNCFTGYGRMRDRIEVK